MPAPQPLRDEVRHGQALEIAGHDERRQHRVEERRVAGPDRRAVQAHTLFTDTALGPDLLDPVGADWTYKREDGQLLLLTIPGA